MPGTPPSPPVSQTHTTPGALGRTLKAVAEDVPHPQVIHPLRCFLVSLRGPQGELWGSPRPPAPALPSPACWIPELACPRLARPFLALPQSSSGQLRAILTPEKKSARQIAADHAAARHSGPRPQPPGGHRLPPPPPARPRPDQMGTDHIIPLRSSRQAAPH